MDQRLPIERSLPHEALIPRFDQIKIDLDFITPPVRNIMTKLKNAGHTSYIVGGCVRDWLLGYDSKTFLRKGGDFDIATSAPVEEMREIFTSFPQILDGMDFGTLKVMIKGDIYEITTYRVDGAYRDGRHPDEVIFSNQIIDDLSRRDFTINAMAADATGSILYPFDGRADLISHRIRTVGKPEARFQEDYLRILRAVRFATTLGFSIEEQTGEAMQAIMKNPRLFTQAVSSERILAELQKILDTAPARGIQLLHKFGLLGVTTPINAVTLEPDSFTKLRDMLAYSRGDWLVNLALVGRYIPTMEISAEKRQEIQLQQMKKYLTEMATSKKDRTHILTLMKCSLLDSEMIKGLHSRLYERVWVQTILQSYRKEDTHINRIGDDLEEIYRVVIQVEQPELLESVPQFLHRIYEHINREQHPVVLYMDGYDLKSLGIDGKIIGLILTELDLFRPQSKEAADEFVQELLHERNMSQHSTIIEQLGLNPSESLVEEIAKRREKIQQLFNQD